MIFKSEHLPEFVEILQQKCNEMGLNIVVQAETKVQNGGDSSLIPNSVWMQALKAMPQDWWSS